MGYRIAVVGATGNVGREILSILSERDFPVDKMVALASHRSLGREISFGPKTILKIQALEHFDFKEVDLVFFAAGSKVSAQYAPIAAKAGAIVIDKSSYFRLEPQIPLIVPEVNPDRLADYKKKNIISSPNCVTIPLTVVLKSLEKISKIKRVVISTYQSVSGAGRRQMDELFVQTRGVLVNDQVKSDLFCKPIAFNLIPQIDSFKANGMTEEEEKISLEVKKIMGTHVQVFATCVRVPVFIGHSISVTVEFESEVSVEQARGVLAKNSAIRLFDRREDGGYITPLECVGEDVVFVSRIRRDPTVPHGLGLWIVSDNIRKGAALNGVQIAEHLIKSFKNNSKITL
ncbi:MAG: aspartate-semialdehyde dehydrogenase [Janthinobacterium lividum]